MRGWRKTRGGPGGGRVPLRAHLGPRPDSARGLGSLPPAPAAYLAGRRARSSSPPCSASPRTGRRAPRAAPLPLGRFRPPRPAQSYGVAMTTGRWLRVRREVGGAARVTGGGGRRKCPRASPARGAGPGAH